MSILSLLLLPCQPTDDGLAKKMLPIYVRRSSLLLAVESAPQQKLELKKEPIFEWLNPARNAQQGVVFLWLRDGRPAALACIVLRPASEAPGSANQPRTPRG
jgi:hypothetical protein